ncbi:MAG: HlyD family efflux transporter periplasmic adaptor subunit [Candidatus Hydrogenedentes bacterium]|nr:HlyD family efflux transporter periplasmic adaptor subunit [Candidatus Hydrogenedentota bacterium]
MSQPHPNRRPRLARMLRTRWAKVLIALLVVLVLYTLTRGGTEEASTGTLFTAARGDLKITVTEGGNVEARESQTIKSKIRGETKILSIIDDGYLVTPEDVANKKVLVTLDNSELLEKMTQEMIQYESARADYAESNAQYEITVKQNESDIKKAELDAKFALMDLQRYLSADIANEILKQRGLSSDVAKISDDLRKAVEASFVINEPVSVEPKEVPEISNEELPAAPSPANEERREGGRRRRAEGEGGQRDERSTTRNAQAASEQSGDAKAEKKETAEVKTEAKSAAATNADTESSTEGGDLPAELEIAATQTAKAAMASIAISERRPDIDFTKFAKPDALGDGEAQQKLRKLESDRLLAEGDLLLSETKLTGTRKLAEKNFVTKQELDNDEMSVKKQTVNRDSAETARDLFVKYEFPKEAEKLLSAYEEAIRAMERTMKQAVAKQAQSEARKKSSEASFALRTERKKELEDQLAACTVVAERPGLVVYGGSDEPWRNREPIEEGATVYERQEIITIPDMTQMAVRVKVHESNIDKIKVGQKAKIKLESFRDEELVGEVVKISVIPDSSSRWMNPDMKLYPATVAISGTYERLKPSMTADVEIMVDELKNVVYVPINAVHPKGSKRVVYVADALGREVEREVETGQFNNAFIEIKNGIEEGDRVYLRAPTSQVERSDSGEEDEEEERQEAPQPSEGGAPSAA